jgi:hypothetical protein
MTGINVFVIAAVFIGVTGPALAETVTCSTSFHQGYRFCDDGQGHRCIEWPPSSSATSKAKAESPTL